MPNIVLDCYPTLPICQSHGLLTTMFAAAGTLLNTSKMVQNQGKSVRYNIDPWDEMMMDRDRRLTGHSRGQKSDPTPPEGFNTSSAWYTQQTS